MLLSRFVRGFRALLPTISAGLTTRAPQFCTLFLGSALASSVFAAGALLGCGAKDIGRAQLSGLSLIASGVIRDIPAGTRCETDVDCDGFDKCAPHVCSAGLCAELPRTECDDNDVCTTDRCVAATGQCEFTPRTPDTDGDGVRAPLPGMLASDPAACGKDCDDARASVYPGATELCDGLDNDCDGSKDEGFEYAPSGNTPVLISGDSQRSDLGGIEFDGTHFVLSLSEDQERNLPQLVALDARGAEYFREPVTRTNSDAYPGSVVNGQLGIASAWEDRRDDDFEIYFNVFDGMGKKLGPDLRVSNARGFSLGASVLAMDDGFAVVWGDRRNGEDFRLFGQRILLNGSFESSSNLELTPDIPGSESPVLAQGKTEIGLAFNAETGVDGALEVRFLTLGHKLDAPTNSVTVATGVAPELLFINGKYYVFWHQYDKLPGDAIWGAVLNPDGSFAISPQRVTAPAAFARGHSALSLGDRILLAWAEAHGDVYDVWVQTLDLSFKAVTAAAMLTSSDGDSLSPGLALGLGGQVGLAYTRHANGGVGVWFNSLGCSP